MSLYPLIFDPLFKYRIWGGEKLRTVLGKECEGEQIGESWEISNIEESKTQVRQGALRGKTLTDLIDIYGTELLGKSVLERFGNEFPLLIKYIDAKTPLSIQVHPDDEVAQKRHNSLGKNEMWYIMESDPAANIVIGFNQDVDQKTFDANLGKGTLEEILHTEKVASGDVFYIPAGRIHAIGAGVLLAEIQQTSNITYRIYDYDRIDTKTGQKRELHNELASDVIDYKSKDSYKTVYKSKENCSVPVVDTAFFKSNIIELSSEINLDYSETDSFVILMCLDGEVKVLYNDEVFTILRGSTVLLPAIIDAVVLQGEKSKILEVTV